MPPRLSGCLLAPFQLSLGDTPSETRRPGTDFALDLQLPSRLLCRHFENALLPVCAISVPPELSAFIFVGLPHCFGGACSPVSFSEKYIEDNVF